MIQHDETRKPKSQQAPVPKVCGADVELGNFVLGFDAPRGTGALASQILLRRIPGVPAAAGSSGWGYGGLQAAYATGSVDGDGVERGAADPWISLDDDPRDRGRKFLATNGGSVYIDSNHLELCLPEVLDAHDHVAAWHAMLRVAGRAQQAANRALAEGLRVEVLANNSDGLGNSYGGHLSFLLSRRCWDDLFHRKLHHLLYLASYQAASVVLAGQGKVGAEQGAPPVDYQLSQRADFLQTMTGPQTTFRRPLVNSRDEPLCAERGEEGWGRPNSHSPGHAGLARLHVIFFDTNLCQATCLMKVGLTQVALAMLEAGEFDPRLILEDPLGTVVRWSHDRTLRARARTLGAQRLTAVEWLLGFLDEAGRFCDRGGCDGVVPRAREILALCADTLDKLRAGELDALAGRLDWVLKLRALEQAMALRPDLTWTSPEIKHLDHVYSALDAESGLYWGYERAGVVERVVDEARIARFVRQPPEETRAWTRAMLLRLAGPGAVHRVDWDVITFHETRPSQGTFYRTVRLAHPLRLGRAETGHLFGPGRTLNEVLDGLTAADSSAYVRDLTWPPATTQGGPAGEAWAPALEPTAASGGHGAAVYDCGSFWHGDL